MPSFVSSAHSIAFSVPDANGCVDVPNQDNAYRFRGARTNECYYYR